MVTLPHPPHRSHLLGFWLGTHGLGLVFLLVAVLLAPGVRSAALMLGILLLITGGAGMANKELRLFGYRGWNRLARMTGRMLQRWVLLVTYLLVLSPLRLAGGKLPLRLQGDSTWEPYPEEEAQHATVEENQARSRPVVSHLLQGIRDRNLLWWLALLPFAALLSGLATTRVEEFDVPTQRYTLY